MIEFINVFLSYLILMVVILIVAAVGFSIGWYFRKKKNQKELQENSGIE